VDVVVRTEFNSDSGTRACTLKILGRRSLRRYTWEEAEGFVSIPEESINEVLSETTDGEGSGVC